MIVGAILFWEYACLALNNQRLDCSYCNLEDASSTVPANETLCRNSSIWTWVSTVVQQSSCAYRANSRRSGLHLLLADATEFCALQLRSRQGHACQHDHFQSAFLADVFKLVGCTFQKMTQGRSAGRATDSISASFFTRVQSNTLTADSARSDTADTVEKDRSAGLMAPCIYTLTRLSPRSPSK